MRGVGAGIFLACALSGAGCGVRGTAEVPAAAPTAPTAPAPPAPVAAEALAATRAATAAVTAPAMLAARDLVQHVVPAQAPLPEQAAIASAAVDLIVRWEVSGETNYRRRLQYPIWPGGASGITWGVGYDGGHQTDRDIRADWPAHADAERLAGTAGLAGTTAREALPRYRDIVTPWDLAREVFAGRSLPAYRTSARRAFGPAGFDGLPRNAQGALVSLVYNRGASMTGDRNAEKRAIRDRCLPTADVQCIGAQLRAMCRLWAGTPNGDGLCRRRADEARLAEGAA